VEKIAVAKRTANRTIASLENMNTIIRSGLRFNTWFLGPTRVAHPNGISIGTVIFVGRTYVINRQTRRQTDRQKTTLLHL